jgi:hypothetical protein
MKDKLKELGLKLANHLVSKKVIAAALLAVATTFGLTFVDEDTAGKIAEALDNLLPEFGVEE